MLVCEKSNLLNDNRRAYFAKFAGITGAHAAIYCRPINALTHVSSPPKNTCTILIHGSDRGWNRYARPY